MTDARSTHLPEVSGGAETVTGTLVIDTRLRNLQTIVVCLGADSVAGAAQATVTFAAPVGGATVKATISVWEDDLVTASTAATTVHWFAIGK